MAWNVILLFLLKRKCSVYWGPWHSKGVISFSVCYRIILCIFILECCLASVLFISSQQCHRRVQILFLGAEEILLLEFISQFYLLKWGKLMDFRERRGAGLVYMLDFLSPKKMNVEAQDQSDGPGRSPISSVPFRTCSCDVLFLFPHVIMPPNNDKSVLLSRKRQQPKSVDSPPT